MVVGTRALKIVVAVLAVFAVAAVFLFHELKWAEFIVALLAALAALALNVVPVGEWVTEFGEMFRSWSDLLRDVEQLELKARDLGDEEQTPEHLVERLNDGLSRQCQLDSLEHAPDEKLLLRCQGDVNVCTYGKGVRTYEEAMAKYKELAEAGAGAGAGAGANDG